MNTPRWNCFCPFCPEPREFVWHDPVLAATDLSVHVANAHPEKAMTVFAARKLVKLKPENGFNAQHPTLNAQLRHSSRAEDPRSTQSVEGAALSAPYSQPQPQEKP